MDNSLPAAKAIEVRAAELALNPPDATPSAPADLAVAAPRGWEKVFIAAQKAEHGPLEWHDRLTLISFWGFLFGPFYYFYKGMWMKGTLLFALAFPLAFLDRLAALAGFNIKDGTNIFISLVCMQYAYKDFYKRAVYDECVWPALSFVGKWYYVLMIYVVGLAAYLVFFYYTDVPSCVGSNEARVGRHRLLRSKRGEPDGRFGPGDARR